MVLMGYNLIKINSKGLIKALVSRGLINKDLVNRALINKGLIKVLIRFNLNRNWTKINCRYFNSRIYKIMNKIYKMIKLISNLIGILMIRKKIRKKICKKKIYKKKIKKKIYKKKIRKMIGSIIKMIFIEK